MKISQAAKIWIDYHVANSKKHTLVAYRWIIPKFCADYRGEELTELPSEKVLKFFNIITDGCKPQTKRVSFSHRSSFFKFMKNNLDLHFQNPCELPMLRKIFRPTASIGWTILETVVFRPSGSQMDYQRFKERKRTRGCRYSPKGS